MRKINSTLMYLMIVGLVACSQAPIHTLDNNLLSTPEINIRKTLSPTLTKDTKLISQTPLEASRTAINTSTPSITHLVASGDNQPVQPTGTPVIPSEARLKVQCLKITKDFPPGFTSTGKIILESWGDESIGDYYLVDLVEGTQILLNEPNERWIDSAVSPHGDRLAIYQAFPDSSGRDIAESNLVISNAQGQYEMVIPWEEAWGRITGWLDDQHLVIDISPENPYKDPAALLVLNPFTGERQILRPDFPDIYSFPPIPSWQGWSEAVYDPTLSRVVYLRGGENGLPSPIHYVLWDLVNQKSLVSFSIVGDLYTIPRWSPDGERLAISPSLFNKEAPEEWPAYELLILSRDGEILQTTNLTVYYPWVYIEDYSWSPDGKYIAFWFSKWDKEKPDFFFRSTRYLAVMDATNGEVVNYCVTGGYDATIGLRIVSPPFWSPDSKQIIFFEKLTENYNRVILIDISLEVAVRITENMLPVGWVK